MAKITGNSNTPKRNLAKELQQCIQEIEDYKEKLRIIRKDVDLILLERSLNE